MEHELSAFYDITHGVCLAILTPHWMKYALNYNTLNKFVEYGIRSFKPLDAEDVLNIYKAAL